MNPRPYQRGAIDAIRVDWDSGLQNALLVLATGLGKTVVFSILGRELRSEGVGKVLVLAHRNELLAQAQDKWLQVEPNAVVGIYQGARKECWADVICASVQSCYPDKVDADGNVLRRGRVHDLPLNEIGLIIIDECHHAPGGGLNGQDGSYIRLLNAAREANPDVLMLGVTATPYRADKVGLGVLWDKVAYRMGISQGIEGGFLVPLRGARVELDIDLSTVKVSKSSGDFVEEDLGRVIDTESARREIVKKWLSEAKGRPTAAFTPTVESAKHLAADFQAAGVAADWVSGAIDKTTRKNRLEAYMAGEIDVLVNCQVLTEGWDAPKTSCILLARPTQSVSMYAQMVGRGTRLLGLDFDQSVRNGKNDCLVMDCVGASKLGLASLADLSAGKESKAPGLDPEEEEELVLDDGPAQGPLFPPAPSTVVVRGASVYEVDLFGGGVTWGKIRECRVACLDIGHSVVAFPGKGGWSVIAISDGTPAFVTEDKPEREAMMAAEEYATAWGKAKFLRPTDYMQRQAATERQVNVLRYLVDKNRRIDPSFSPGLPPSRDGRSPFETMSHPQASLWIAYLKARVAMWESRRARAAAEREVAA